MKRERAQLGIFFTMTILLLVGLMTLVGCKKETETDETTTVELQVGEAIEQTVCPVMEGPISKNYYTEYLGKKVYFCCPGCKEKFEKEPKKYLAKLPQFSK